MTCSGAPVIANVMHGRHFVLVVGYAGDGDTLYVNDPGFERSTYSFAADVVGLRLYNVSAPAPVEGPALAMCSARATRPEASTCVTHHRMRAARVAPFGKTSRRGADVAISL